MKTLIAFLFLVLESTLRAQTPTYYHDAALDGIQNNVGVLHNDITNETSVLTNTLLTIPNWTAAGSTVVGISSNQVGGVIIFAVESNEYSDLQAFSNAFQSTPFSPLENTMESNAVTYGIGSSNGLVDGTNYNSTVSLGVTNIATGTVFLFDFMTLFNNPSFQNMGAEVRNLILICVSIWFYQLVMGWIHQKIERINNQNQIKGSTESLFGFNASIPVALVYAAIISTVLVTVLTLLVSSGVAITAISALISFPSAIQSLEVDVSTPANAAYSGLWATVTTFIPVGSIVGFFLSYLAFRYGYGWWLVITTEKIVRDLLA